MSGQPFMYSAYQSDSRFPTTTFDPRAVTRASRETSPSKPKPTGPLVSFNIHPDAHEVLLPRSAVYSPLGSRTKFWIKCLRQVQLGLRLLQLLAAAGVLALFTLFTNVDTITTWVVRIMQAVTIFHCLYATFHLSRRAADRTPASSAAYHFFAGSIDFLCIVAYILGVFVVRGRASGWGTRLSNQTLMKDFVPAVYYSMMGASGLHSLTLSSSAWLGWIFRRISSLPPDMNPLEDLLTTRPFHKRNKSSMSTTDSPVEGEKRPWTQSDSRRDSAEPSSRPSISFMDTRVQSAHSNLARVNLPSRQYQIAPGSPPRGSNLPPKAKQHKSLPGSSGRGTYAELPLADEDSARPEPPPHADLFMSGANAQNTAMTAAGRNHRSRDSKSYAALAQPYDMGGYSSESDHEGLSRTYSFAAGADRINASFPNPLGSHPTSPDQGAGQAKPALRPWSFSRGLDYGALPGTNHGRDIADEELRRDESESRQRDSSIQAEEFFSVSHGHTRNEMAPISVSSIRKASGNDYATRHSSITHDRRHAGGKMAEEGQASGQYWHE